MEKVYYSLKEASTLVGLSVSTLRRDCIIGKLKAYKYGNKWLLSQECISHLKEIVESGENIKAQKCWEKITTPRTR